MMCRFYSNNKYEQKQQHQRYEKNRQIAIKVIKIEYMNFFIVNRCVLMYLIIYIYYTVIK